MSTPGSAPENADGALLQCTFTPRRCMAVTASQARVVLFATPPTTTSTSLAGPAAAARRQPGRHSQVADLRPLRPLHPLHPLRRMLMPLHTTPSARERASCAARPPSDDADNAPARGRHGDAGHQLDVLQGGRRAQAALGTCIGCWTRGSWRSHHGVALACGVPGPGAEWDVSVGVRGGNSIRGYDCALSVETTREAVSRWG